MYVSIKDSEGNNGTKSTAFFPDFMQAVTTNRNNIAGATKKERTLNRTFVLTSSLTLKSAVSESRK
jgi:hypothetical protein